MSQLTAQTIFGGPAYVLIGNPCTDAGAGLVALGRVPDVEVTIEVMRQSVQNEIGQALKDGQFGAVISAKVSITMLNKSAAILSALMPEAATVAAGNTFSTDFAALTMDSIVIIPEADKTLGTANGVRHIWIPAARFDNIGAFKYQIAKGGGDDGTTFTAEYTATLASTDQDGDPLTEGYRLLHIGPPSSGVTWSLPAAYAP